MPEQNWERDAIRRPMSIRERCRAKWHDIQQSESYDVPFGVAEIYAQLAEQVVRDLANEVQAGDPERAADRLRIAAEIRGRWLPECNLDLEVR